jgi:exodeoxyribonuclease V gamma subunit
MHSDSGFFLHHSNQLPALASALGQCLHADAHRDILQADTILIPQPSMRRWLQNRLGEDFGIAANLEFVPPGAFIDRMLLPWSSPDSARTLTNERLQWRLLRQLLDERLLARPAFAPIASYLQAGDRQNRAWRLAGELTQVYEKYQAWRRPWLLSWSRHPPPADWQAQLWHQVSQGQSYRALTLEAYLSDLARADCPKPPGLPARLSIFACQNLSPDVLKVLQSFGRWCRVDFFLHNPCEAYWGDVQAPNSAEALLALREDNPLLNQWGFAGRDFVASLLSDQSVEWVGEAAYYRESEDTSLLQRVQNDILTRSAPEPVYEDHAAMAADDSIQIHCCASPLREVQMLRAQLLACLHADPGLHWRDIVIMAPDLEPYVPYFAPVFSQQADGYPALPFSLSDRSIYPEAGIADLFFRLLALGRSRLTSNEGFDLLSHPLVAEHYGLKAADLALVHAWLAQAQVRWGLNARHRADTDGEAQTEFTWRHAVKRLIFGYASDDALVADTAPADLPNGQQQPILDSLCRFIDCLEEFHAGLSREAPAAEWQNLLSRILQTFCSDANRLPELDREAFNRLNRRIASLPALAEDAGLHQALSLSLVESYLADEGEQRLSQAWLSGRITICKMVPMRLIPFKVVCLLGLDEAAFPRQDPDYSLDRMADIGVERCLGDRSTRNDDRFMMLQTLNACQHTLIISYVGIDPVTGNALPPSLLIRELSEAVSRYAEDADSVMQNLIIRHPIHALEPAADPRIACLLAPPAESPKADDLHLFAALATDPPAPATDGCEHIALQAFMRFWLKPVESLGNRLGFRKPEQGLLLPENEPFGSAAGLSKYQLVEALLAQRLANPSLPVTEICRHFQAQGLLPAGAAGLSRLLPLMPAIERALTDLSVQRIAPRPWPVDLTFDRARLYGTLDQQFAAGMITLALHVSEPRPRDRISAGIHALLASACAYELPSLIYTERLSAPLARCSRSEAEHRLRTLLDYYLEGQQRIVCFDPKHSSAWLQAKHRDPALSVEAWIDQQLVREDNQSGPGDSGNLTFLTYGEGFLQAVARRNPGAFAKTSAAVYEAILGADAHD